MVIGGKDIFFEYNGFSPDDAKSVVQNIVARHWPNAVYEEVDMGIKDFFVYEDESSKKIWDDDMPDDPSTANMIYVLFGDKELTMVCDEGCPSEAIANEVRQYIRSKDGVVTKAD